MNKFENATAIPWSQSRLLMRVSLMYYNDGYTQKEIGEQLDLSRIKVNRLLKQAREVGIVEITITPPTDVYVQLEQALCKRYGIKEAVVVSEAAPGKALYLSLAQGSAAWLDSRLEDGMIIGIGQGRTISAIPQVFAIDRSVKCTFAEIVGGAGTNPGDFGNYNVTSKIAELVNAQASYIYAPTIVSSEEIRDTLLQEKSIANALELARQAEIVIHSVGPVDQTALLYIHGYLNDDDLAQLHMLGAAGDTLSQFFDVTGKCVEHSICDRVIGLTLDDLRAIPYSVIVAGGQEKVEVLRAAMQGKLLNVLITDLNTATALLKEPQ